MKDQEIEEGNTVSNISIENDELSAKYLELNDYSTCYPNKKPKTMKNNCVNLKCMDSIQRLWSLKEKYRDLEAKYFQLENSGSKKSEEFEELLKKKEKEEMLLNKMKAIYIDHSLKEIDYFDLKNLDAKLLRTIELIQSRKQKLFLQLAKHNIFNDKVCIVCYENEIKVLLKPCNHLCVCEKCSIRLEECPLCRKGIRDRDIVKYSYNY